MPNEQILLLADCRTVLKRSEGTLQGVLDVIESGEARDIIRSITVLVARIDASRAEPAADLAREHLRDVRELLELARRYVPQDRKLFADINTWLQITELPENRQAEPAAPPCHFKAFGIMPCSLKEGHDGPHVMPLQEKERNTEHHCSTCQCPEIDAYYRAQQRTGRTDAT